MTAAINATLWNGEKQFCFLHAVQIHTFSRAIKHQFAEHPTGSEEDFIITPGCQSVIWLCLQKNNILLRKKINAMNLAMRICVWPRHLFIPGDFYTKLPFCVERNVKIIRIRWIRREKKNGNHRTIVKWHCVNQYPIWQPCTFWAGQDWFWGSSYGRLDVFCHFIMFSANSKRPFIASTKSNFFNSFCKIY